MVVQLFPYVFVCGIALLVFPFIYRTCFLKYKLWRYYINAKLFASEVWNQGRDADNAEDRRELFAISHELNDLADGIKNNSVNISLSDYSKKLLGIMPKKRKKFESLPDVKKI